MSENNQNSTFSFRLFHVVYLVSDTDKIKYHSPCPYTRFNRNAWLWDVMYAI